MNMLYVCYKWSVLVDYIVQFNLKKCVFGIKSDLGKKPLLFLKKSIDYMGY